MTSPVRPLDPELLSFLQTLVNGGDEPQPEKTDSDKENEAGQNNGNIDTVESQRGSVRFSGTLDASGNGKENIQTNETREHRDKVKDKDGGVKEGDDKNETGEGDTRDGQEQEGGVNLAERDVAKTKHLKKKKRKVLRKAAQRPVSAHPTVTRSVQPDADHQTEGNEPVKQETLSDTGRRRLGRRKQVPRPRCAGPEPKGDILQQKYLELRQLIVTPLVHPGQSQKLSRQQLLRMQAASQEYAVADSLPQAGNSEINGARKHVYIDLNQNNSDDGYGTIRTVQILTHAKSESRPHTASHKQRPPSGRSRALSASQAEDSTKSVVQGERGRVRNRNERNCKLERGDSGSGRTSQATERHSSEDKNRSGSQSPRRVVQPSDTHLKNTNNPLLKQWLKKKEKELRRRKREERKKAREEREKKQELEQEKQESLKESDQKVRDWMEKKRKEALLREKEARKMIKEEEKKMLERQQRQQLAPASRPLTPASRPLTPAGDETTRSVRTVDNFIIHNGENITPSPPPSKFVYKRPVSGRVKLIKFQQVRKEDAKRAELEKEKFQKKLAEEKARKMRVSYDQWLLKKRGDDYARRQEAARQRAMAKSDPELERIVPQLARNRIENIQRGKKKITMGVSEIEEGINKSFGGGDFDQQVENSQVQGRYQLGVLGSKSNLSARPSSAKIQITAPPMSKSPRRPASAHPAIDTRIQNGDSSVSNPFKLPFPPEQGAPKHVLDKQSKLFAPKVTLTTPSGQQVSNIESQSDQQPLIPQFGVEKDNRELPPDVETAVAPPTSDHPDKKSTAADDNKKNSELTFLSYFVTPHDVDQEKDGHGAIKFPREHFVEEVAEELPEESGDYDSSSKSSSISDSPRSNSDTSEQNTMQRKIDNVRDALQDAAVNPNDLYENLSLDLGNSEDEEEPHESQVYDATPEKSDETVEDRAGSELSESKNFGKHVSFQENPVVFEPPDLEDDPADDPAVGPDGVVDEGSRLFDAQSPYDDDGDDDF